MITEPRVKANWIQIRNDKSRYAFDFIIFYTEPMQACVNKV